MSSNDIFSDLSLALYLSSVRANNVISSRSCGRSLLRLHEIVLLRGLLLSCVYLSFFRLVFLTFVRM